MLTPVRACVLLAIVWLLPVSEIAEARGPRGGAGARPAAGFSRGGGPAPPGVRSNAAAPSPRSARPAAAGGHAAQPSGRSPAELQQFLSSRQPTDRNRPVANGVQSAAHHHHTGPQPFTPAWYADHPHAWHHTHPHADAAVVASAAAVTGWLAYGAYPATSTTNTTVVYESSPAPSQPAPADSDPASPAPEWLSLGVYHLSPSAAAAPTQMVQLSAARDGELRGVYFDHLTGTTQNLVGRIDNKTQRASWSMEGNPSVRFVTTLADLTQPSGAVTVTLPTGDQTWALSRASGL